MQILQKQKNFIVIYTNHAYMQLSWSNPTKGASCGMFLCGIQIFKCFDWISLKLQFLFSGCGGGFGDVVVILVVELLL